ncbi:MULTISPECIES: thioredoxin [Atopobiaceae]|uniref:Thioredoxin n=1 Tax=Parafannyhessea umbonata TaxID=604330 RepID=A0A1H9NYW6_9ACTN|nr:MULTISPECIES: thioredoxin [Atopobiaceae]SEH68868.1 thioredoxin [Parafannyhessea umbonata]SER41007.1 thioredoxin [Parafannyhessea umbonata]SJZ53876.1 thioredoxin [Olsenella sp. KH1P3]
MEYSFTAENFEQEVLNSDIPVLIDFYADWCGPCRSMLPIVESLAQKYEGRVKVGKVNSDEQQELAKAFNVMSIPSFFIVKDGKVIDNLVGRLPQEMLEQKLDAIA